MTTQQTLINSQIKLTSVRVIDEDGTQHGVMSSDEAQQLAAGRDLDLVLIAPNSNPPVCRVIDWGKYQFTQKKKAKESKGKQSVVEVKEIQLRPTIDSHDLETKLNHVRKFLSKGKHVRFSMRFRGRENSHSEIGMDLMNGVLKTLENDITVEKPPKLNGNMIIMVVSPTK